MIVKCAERFFSNSRKRLYYPGDQDDIDPLEPIAKYFEGWPPGTEVYTKSKGVEGTKIIPGDEPESEQKRSPGRPRKTD